MIGLTRKVEVAPLQSEANASFNPFPATENATDIQSIKTAFLADPDIIEAFKGDAGPQGQIGPAGDSVIVMSADPTDSVLSKVGDLYLNATSGTLYQRSGITQAQFYATGQQGIVLPNSIWIRKGNLKGATGAKGDKGGGIINGSGHPKSTITILPEVGTLYLNKDTFSMYQRSATEFLTPPVQQGVTDYSDGYWQYIGSLKGENGEKGENGKSSFEVLQGTGIFLLTNEHIGKTLIIKADSGITNVRYNNVTIEGSTVFLLEKNIGFTKTNESPATGLEGFAGDYCIIENYTETVNGFWLAKKSLKGDKGESGNNFHSLLKIEFSDFLTHQINSDYLNFTVPTDFALFTSVVNNGGRFVAFIYNNETETWDRLEITIDEVINNGVNYEMSIIMPFGFEDGISENLWNLSTLKIFFAGFDLLLLPNRSKQGKIFDVISNSVADFSGFEIIRLMSGYNPPAFSLPDSNVNHSYRYKTFKFLRTEGPMVEFIDNNTQDIIFELGFRRSVEFYCDESGNWKVIGL